MSGRFPESENMEVFWKNLVEATDMITENNRLWDIDAWSAPRRMGKIPTVDKFDAEHFGIPGTQADKMDPRTRILLEVSHEAVVDAGVNPKCLSGSRTGVFVAISFAEASDIWLRSTENPSGHYVTGAHPCMVANRISYVFNFSGPSCILDTACSSSFYALHYAFLALRNDICDSVIVGAAAISFFPSLSQVYDNVQALSADGNCKAFDSRCNGFARSECVVALYICSKYHAKRSYATVVGVRCSNDGYKPEGITVPSAEMQKRLMKELYEEVGVDPLDVCYVEAHGTGTKVGDPREISAFDDVFCIGRNRPQPLLVGSVKTNMGHSEPAAGLAAVAKVLLSGQAGLLPGNLHFENPNPECAALIDGRIRVVTELTPFPGEFVGINSLGMGGTNGHAIFQFDGNRHDTAYYSAPTHKYVDKMSCGAMEENGCRESEKAEDSEENLQGVKIPTIILAAGRTEEAVQYFLRQASTHSSNREFVGLLHELSRTEFRRQLVLGYIILSSSDNELMLVSRKKQEWPPPVWFVFSGQGGQWLGMSSAMMRFKQFRNSIKLSESLLRRQGVELVSILQTQDLIFLNHVTNVNITIAAFQVGLVDMLRSVNILPDGIIGHSLGESTSAYADGCLTQEQTLLSAYNKAKAFTESNLPEGTMASIGLSWEDAQSRSPADVFPIIHNTLDNVTIAGPERSVLSFIDTLSHEGCFAKEVKYATYGFHTPSMRKCKKLLLRLLKQTISSPKRRSSKWLSTSIVVSDWDSALAQFASAEYFTNNAVSPVYLYEAVQQIPEGAVVLEISPHCFLQSFLKQTLPSCSVLGLMRKEMDNSTFFLKALGEAFVAGILMDISALYEPVTFPVSANTPSISSMIKWDHSYTWEVPDHKNEISAGRSIKFTVNVSSDEELASYLIHDSVTFPAAGYIWLAWKALAKQKNANFERLLVRLEDIRFRRMTVLPPDVNVNFCVVLTNGSFEITEGEDVVCDGKIRDTSEVSCRNTEIATNVPCTNASENILLKLDFYKLLNLKGYHLKGDFQGVHKISLDEKWVELEWYNNWIALLDSMLQILIFSRLHKELLIPARLQAVEIDPITFNARVRRTPDIVPANRQEHLGTVQCAGIQVRGLAVSTVPAPNLESEPTISAQKFHPYISSLTVSMKEAVEFFIGVVVDNSSSFEEKTFVLTEILSKSNSTFINLKVLLFLKNYDCEHRIIRPHGRSNEEIEEYTWNQSPIRSVAELKSLPPSNIIWTDCFDEVPEYSSLLSSGRFVILCVPIEHCVPSLAELVVVAERRTSDRTLYLLRKTPTVPSEVTWISIDQPGFAWVELLQLKIQSLRENCKLYIVSTKKNSGIIGFIKCLIREPDCQNIRCVYSLGSISFDPNNDTELSNDIVRKDLVYNVHSNNAWGCIAQFTLEQKDALHTSAQVNAQVMSVGDLSSLCWVESQCKLHESECHWAHFAGLNFRDVMYATGQLSKSAFPEATQLKESILGAEYAGTYMHRRVCGMSGAACLASVLDHEPKLVYDVPPQWSLAEAATVPAVYSSTVYALIIRGLLSPGETILIHTGSGGVGLASVTIALGMNCEVFTTVGSVAKRELLKRTFPMLNDDNIFDSNGGFEEGVLIRTNGKGVDVVLNSLASEKLQASLRCVGYGGRFLEIGKVDAFSNTAVGLAVLLQNINIQGIHIDQVFEKNFKAVQQIQELTQLYIHQGKAQPLPFTMFGHEQLENAFRFLVSRKHVGKVIIKIRDDSEPLCISANPRSYFYSHKTYVLVGGLGGMGLEIVDWMIERGARKLFIVSRSGIMNSYQNYMVKKWRDSGTQIFLTHTLITSRLAVFKFWKEVSAVGPPGGFFNLAINLQDGIFVNQTVQTFDLAVNCKEAATMHFDAVSRLYSPTMDYFVVFSSVVSAKGNPGQSNYGYGNSAMERICEQRKADGFHGLAIQWGAVAQVGSLEKVFPGSRTFLGMTAQSIGSCVSTFDIMLQQQEAVLSSFVIPTEENTVSTHKSVSIAQTVARILGVQDLSKVDVNATLSELGMDSIMLAQVKHAFQAKESIFLSESDYAGLTFKYMLGLAV